MNKKFLALVFTTLVGTTQGCGFTIGLQDDEKCKHNEMTQELNVLIKQAIADSLGYVEDFGSDAVNKAAVYISNRQGSRQKCPLAERLAVGATCEGYDSNIDFTGTDITGFNRGPKWLQNGGGGHRKLSSTCSAESQQAYRTCITKDLPEDQSVQKVPTPFCATYCHTCDATLNMNEAEVCTLIQTTLKANEAAISSCLAGAVLKTCEYHN